MSAPNVRHFFQSIRGRLTAFFLVGILSTLIIVAVLSYQIINSTVSENNGHTTAAEFSQISGNLSNLYRNIDQQMVQLIGGDYFVKLTNHEKYSDLAVTNALRDLGSSVFQLTSYFPYVHSVAVLYDDGSNIVASPRSFRYSFAEDAKSDTSQKVWDTLADVKNHTSIRGSFTTEDYPNYIDAPSTRLLSFMRRLSRCVLIVNVREDYVEDLYAGITEIESYHICLLNTDGEILSSLQKDELGTQYADFDRISEISGDAEVSSFSTRTHQILWHVMEDCGLIVTNRIDLSSYKQSVGRVRNMVVLMFSIGMMLTCGAFFLWIRKIFAPMAQLERSMSEAGRGNYQKVDVSPAYHDEISLLIRNYDLMLDQLAVLDRSKRQAEEQYRDSELKALRSQLNPHFLYNTLNVLKWMAIERNEPQIAEGLTSLGTIIAPLYKTDSPEHTLREERSLLDKYVSIMNLRFGGKVTIQSDIPPALEDAMLPRFCLQPIVENSYIHGFSTLEYQGVIRISASQSPDGTLTLRISDNGVGLSDGEIGQLNLSLTSAVEKKSVGLYNTCARLQLRYGSDYRLRASAAEGGGLCITLRLPLHFRKL